MRTQTLTKQMYTASLDRDRDFHFRVKDPGSAATHFIGFLAAVLMTPVLLVHAAGNGADFMTMIGMSVFMISMILFMVQVHPIIHSTFQRRRICV